MSPTTPQLIHNFLETSARDFPEKIALVHNAVRLSYREINRNANGICTLLQDRGVSAGDRVLLFAENGPEFVSSYYGILKTGAIAVPLPADTKKEQIDYYLDELKPTAVVCSSKADLLLGMVYAPDNGIKVRIGADNRNERDFVSFEQCFETGTDIISPATISPGHLANIIYTSGSTGRPKGVMLTHGNIVANTLSITEYLNITHKDIQMIVLPFFYVMGLSLLNTHVAAGARIVINNRFAFPATVLSQMAEEKVTAFSGVPATFAFLLHRSPLREYRERLPALRYCSQAGGHMPNKIKSELRKVLPAHTKIHIMYGATEAAARLTWLDPTYYESKLGSIGKAIPGVTMRVIGATGRENTANEEGELVASGPNIMKGYWNNCEAIASVIDESGYHTGDLGYRDNDGFFYVTGRKDNVVKVGGYRINPQEIEDALMETGLLVEVAVIAISDPLLGTALVALACPVTVTTTIEDLGAECSKTLPKYKLPQKIIFTIALPKNANGKIDRAACRNIIAKPSSNPENQS